MESVETFGGGGDGGKGRGGGGGCGLLLLLSGQEGMERPVDHDDDLCGGACAGAGVPSSITGSGNVLAHDIKDGIGKGASRFVVLAAFKSYCQYVMWYAGSGLSASTAGCWPLLVWPSRRGRAVRIAVSFSIDHVLCWVSRYVWPSKCQDPLSERHIVHHAYYIRVY